MPSSLRRALAAGSLGLLAAGTAAVPAHAAPAPGWRVVHKTVRTSSTHYQFADVTALSAKDAWAVGSRRVDGGDAPFAMRWNGRSWTQAAIPGDLMKGYDSVLEHVTATGAKDVWAFGAARRQSGDRDTRLPFAIRWDGVRWTRQFLSAKDSWITDATSTGKPGELWMAGFASPCKGWTCTPWAKRFDGKAWRSMPLPKGGIFDFSARKSTGVWATANLSATMTTSPVTKPALARWDGGKWRTVAGPKIKVPRGYYGHFDSLWASGPKTAWASISYDTLSGESPTISALVHWNGKKWTTYKSTQRLTTLEYDGQGGLWALGRNRKLYRFAKAKWTVQNVPGWTGANNESQDIAQIPGTKSTWSIGAVRGDAIVWKHGA